MTTEKKLVGQEGMKVDSRYLKGKIAEELADPAIAEVSDYSYELLKFHGTYQGYNRDTATERKKAGLDKEHEFMVRLRIPAGGMTAEQYLAMDELAGKYANDSIRITTRQTFQFHVILKENLKKHIAEINQAMLSTLSACGDVVRNVMASNAPIANHKYARLKEDTARIVELCAPKTSSYDELWNDKTDSNRENDAVEPLYGETYLPRKFKIGLIIPEDNGIDVFSHDLGIVLIYEGETLKGYNILMGGGFGMNHNQPATYPRLATPIAFVGADDLLNAVEAVVKLQRDHGDRTNRKHARLKYVVEENGIEWTRKTLEKYFADTNPSAPLQDAVPVEKYSVPDYMGWHEQGDGKWYLGIPVPSGRVVDYNLDNPTGYNTGENKDFAGARYRTGLRDVIRDYGMNLVLTADQNIVLCDIDEGQKGEIEQKLRGYGIQLRESYTNFQRNFLACVALPTCGKALAEAERVQFPLMDDIQAVLDKHGISDEKLAVRVTGCPNGCARPYVGDIGIVGRMPGHYVLFIGGDFEGTRLNTKVFDKVPQADIAKALDPMIALFVKERTNGEGFGDFCHRYGIENVVADAKAALDFKWAQAA